MRADRPTAAYVHVPFCVHRCGYCDFTVIAGRDDLIPAFLRGIGTELALTLVEPQPVRTLFLGGGTPSYLSADDLASLLGLLQHWLPLEPDGEFSIECNPEGFTTDRMQVLAGAGVNRVSLGVQSFDPLLLKTLERGHTPDNVADVVARLRRCGIDNISIDLIFGVPDQTLEGWRQTLSAAVALSPTHLSTYGLTYEKGTAFWTRRERRQLQPVPEELEREMYSLAMDWLPAQGWKQYELSNFAQPGGECRHNQVYWEGDPFWGFGPGAAADVSGVRTLNHRSVTGWLSRIEQRESPVMEQESLAAEDRAREAVMLGLRRISGIDLQAFQSRYGVSLRDLEPVAYDRFLGCGWLEDSSGRLRLTREGRFVADTVMSEFL